MTWGSVLPGLWIAAACLVALSGCGASRPPLPLRPEPVPYVDTLPAEEPAARSPNEPPRIFEVAIGGQLVRPFDVRRWTGTRREALNVTHFDRVVPSAWFVPRNHRRAMSPEEVARGAGVTPPADTGTLVVVGGKSAGISPGFTVRDARGHLYLFKFDPEGYLHLASSADVITSRLLHAAGYHVPEDYKVAFDSARLHVGDEATITTSRGERPMRPTDIREVLKRTEPLGEGRFLALASRFVPGTPKGPFFFSGVRGDDPNDHYHHQYRRELRGLYVVSAWLNHVDMRFANTLDAYVEPGYLRHYLIDFAASLGSGTIRPHRPREGREYNVDVWASLGRLFSLGFYRVGWEDEEDPSIHPSIGWLPTGGYDPGGWKANWPNPAFRSVTARDGYWGAKLVASFTDAQIRAAVRAGDLPDPAAADTLGEILMYRRDRTVEHWYGRVTPIEDVSTADVSAARQGSGPRGGLAVRFRDLGLEEGVWTSSATTYRWRLRHRALDRDLSGRTGAESGARQELRIPLRAGGGAGRRGGDLSSREALARLRITAVRPGAAERPAVVHLRWRGPDGGYRVVGLEH